MALCITILVVISIAVYQVRSLLPLLGILVLVSIGVYVLCLVAILVLYVLRNLPKPEAIHIGQSGTILVQNRLFRLLYYISEHRPLEARSTARTVIEEVKPVIPTVSKLLSSGIIGMGKLVLGCYADGTPRLGSWNDIRSFIVAGKSRSGKTVTLFFLTIQLILNRAEVILCDPHKSKPTGLANMLAPLSAYVHTVNKTEDIVNAVLDFADELENRIESNIQGNPKVLVIDEWTRLVRHKEVAKQIIWCTQAVSQEGAGYNMFLVLGGQLVNPRSIGNGEILQSIHAAYIHRLDMKQSMYVLQDSRAAKKTPTLRTGTSLLKDTEGDITEMCIPRGTSTDAVQVAIYLKQHSIAGPTKKETEKLANLYNDRQIEAPVTRKEGPLATGETIELGPSTEKLEEDMLKVYQAFKQNMTSARTIADTTGIGRTKVNDLLNRLQLLGFIDRTEPHRNNCHLLLVVFCSIGHRCAFE